MAERFRAIPKGFDPFPEETAAQAIDNKDNAHSEHKNDHGEHKNDHLDDHLTVKKPFKEPKGRKSVILTESQMRAFLGTARPGETRAEWLARNAEGCKNAS
jgi:hypothetical protein